MNTYRLYEQFKTTMDDAAAKVLASTLGDMYDDLSQTVTKAEFRELKEVVADLAQAQKRTEQRVEELAQAQRRTEQRVEELTQAQKRTEEAIQGLGRRLDDTNKQLGGLSATVGYSLENESYEHLPRLLERDHGLKLLELPYRGYLKDDLGTPMEVNIIARAERKGTPLLVVGECKVQLSKNELDRFLKRRVRVLEESQGPLFPVLVAHMTSEPDVRDYARSQNLTLYLSYELKR